MEEKRDNPIGYRPKGVIKDFLDEVARKDSPISKAQVIEIALRLLLKDHRQIQSLRDIASQKTEGDNLKKGSWIKDLSNISGVQENLVFMNFAKKIKSPIG